MTSSDIVKHLNIPQHAWSKLCAMVFEWTDPKTRLASQPLQDCELAVIALLGTSKDRVQIPHDCWLTALRMIYQSLEVGEIDNWLISIVNDRFVLLPNNSNAWDSKDMVWLPELPTDAVYTQTFDLKFMAQHLREEAKAALSRVAANTANGHHGDKQA